MPDIFVNLAKKTIKIYLKENRLIEPPPDLPPEMFKNKAGVFVSLHKKNGELRGCIGTFLPTKENIAQEIIHNAISAAFHDPRFYPITKDELDDLEISVDVLSEPEPIDSIDKLNVKKYGIIVKTDDGRTGLLLPDIEDVETVDEQILIACQKAGINPAKEKFSIFRFTVERHK
ncbi:MAG: AmmeMemoRadiSam system protein A [Patescibacteria group bacterium]